MPIPPPAEPGYSRLPSTWGRRWCSVCSPSPTAWARRSWSPKGVTPDALRQAATTSRPPAAGDVPTLIPFDAGASRALELTSREALRPGHDHIGTEHLLLALLEAEDGAGLLTGLGVDKSAAEAHLVAALAVLTPPAAE